MVSRHIIVDTTSRHIKVDNSDITTIIPEDTDKQSRHVLAHLLKQRTSEKNSLLWR